jgi:hypothetical protein
MTVVDVEARRAPFVLFVFFVANTGASRRRGAAKKNRAAAPWGAQPLAR